MFQFNDKLYLLVDDDKIAVTIISKTLSANAKKARVEDALGSKFWAETANLIRPEEWLQTQVQQPKLQTQKIYFTTPTGFVEFLKPLMQPEAIKELCDRLLNLPMFATVSEKTKMQRLSKDYNKLINSMDCELVEGKNAFYQTKQDGSQWLRHLYFKYTGIADYNWAADNKKAAEKVTKNLSNQIAGLDADRYQQSVAQLLQSFNVWEIGAGLVAASGRRPIEIIEVGQFEVDGNGLLFGGQAKKRDEQSEPYSIPLIGCAPDLFVEKLTVFRNSYEVQQFREQFTIDGEVDLKKLSDPLTKQICRRGIVPRLAWIPTVEGKATVTASDLRAAWVTVVEEKFKPTGKYSLLFRAEVLGHKVDVGSMPTLNYSRYAEPAEIAEPIIEVAPNVEPEIEPTATEPEPAYQFAIGEQVSTRDRTGTIAEIRDGEYLVVGENFEQWVQGCDLEPVATGDRTHSITTISLHQPWASLIAHGQKTYETRSWSTKYRGSIAIHAAKKVPGNLLSLPCTRELVPLGAVVAIADLVDCIEMSEEFIAAQSDLERSVGDWSPGRFAWQLVNVRPIVPIPAKGKQGLFKWEMPRVLEIVDGDAVIPVLAGAIGLIEIENNLEKCSEPSNCSAVLVESGSALNPLAASSSIAPAKSPKQPAPSTAPTGPIPQPNPTSEISELNPDSLTALLGAAPAKISANAENALDLTAIDPVYGGKCSESLMNASPVLLDGKTLRERCLADAEKLLPASEWSATRLRVQQLFQQRNLERHTNESASFLLPTPTTYPSGSKPGNSPAGRNNLETKLRLLLPTPRANDGTQGYNTGKTGGINMTGQLKATCLLPIESSNPQVWGWMMGFPANWCESVLMPDGLKALADLDGGNEISPLSELAYPAKESPAAESASVTMEPPVSQLKQSPSHSESSTLPIAPDLIESGTSTALAADNTHTAHNLEKLGGNSGVSALCENFEEKSPNNFVSAPAPEKNIEPSIQKFGTSVNGRHSLDFYETPVWMSLLILKYVPLAGIIGEVCSGHGAIARILKMAGHSIWTNDIDPAKPADYHLDAASPLLWGNFPVADWIITNPPYASLSAPIIQAAYTHAKRGVVMLLRQDWDEGCGDRINFLKAHPPTTKIIIPRYCFRRGKNGAWATDDDPVCIYIWDKKVTNKLTRCIWLAAEEILLYHRTPDTAPSTEAIATEVAKYQVVSTTKEVILDCDRQKLLDKFIAYNQALPIKNRWRISNSIIQHLLACSDKLASDWNATNQSLLVKLNNGLGHTHNRGRKFNREFILKQLEAANV